jgi:putative transposase
LRWIPKRGFRLPISQIKSAPTPRHGHRALRRWRVSIPHRTYFITACTHERQRLFESTAAADLVFQHLYGLEADPHGIELIASVVMPDHVHTVFRLCNEPGLETTMKRFRGSSAQVINRALNRTGPVWQRGYFDRLLRPDERLETVLHYLWHNPTPPGLHFRCRREIWEWFRTCVNDRPEYYDWLKLNP